MRSITLSRPVHQSRFFSAILALSCLLTGGVLIGILGFLLWQSISALTLASLVDFFASVIWHPLSGEYGMLAMLVASGTLALSSLLIALPIAVFIAVWMRFFAATWLRKLYRSMLELLAAIPSVVYGLWGLLVIVPWLVAYAPPGTSLLAGMLTLSLVLLPVLIVIIDSTFAAVPVHYAQAAAALNISRVGFVRKIVLPVSMSGIFSGALLQLGRALGETIIVLMVCGNVVQLPSSLFDPVRTLTANIALEMGYALADHQAVLFLGGLTLTLFATAVIGVAYWCNKDGYVKNIAA